jgi:RimJ/RimL family protein N-acetyltransferase
MKPCVRGKSIFLREVTVDDAEFIVDLRTNPDKSRHLSVTSTDLRKQQDFILSYFNSRTDFYFLICDWEWQRLGTVRIYDICGDSFSWGSWIVTSDAPKNTAIESALLVYDYAFYSLHYSKSHFDVRKKNERVVEFHKRFGADVVREDDLNYYFQYQKESYIMARNKYRRYLL